MEDVKVVVFQAGKEEYGIPVEYVISIEKMQETNSIPQMPSYVLGIINIRGELVPVFDTNIILYNKETVITEKTRIIVVKTASLSYGLVVSDAKEILDVPGANIKQLNLLAYQNATYFIGVANLENRLVTILNPNKLQEKLEGISEVKEHMKSHQ